MLGNNSFKDLVIKYLILFIVIVAGIFIGIVVSIKTGLTERLSQKTFSPIHLNNTTLLQIGDSLPPIRVFDGNGGVLDLVSALNGRRTVLSFVSEGCYPCHAFVEDFDSFENIHTGDIQLVLLSVDPNYFIDKYAFEAFRVSPEDMQELQINAFPTIIGIDEEGTVRFVSSGFSRIIDEDFITKNLRPRRI